MLCLQKTKIPNGFNTFGGEKRLSLPCSARPPTWALAKDVCVRPAEVKRLEQSTGDNKSCFPEMRDEKLSKATPQQEKRDNTPSY